VSKNEAIGYIYFDYNDPKSFEPESILRNLLTQLLFHLQTVPDSIEALHDECRQKGKSPDMSDLKQHLTVTCAKFNGVFLLFDALDEISAENSKDVMLLLSDFRNAAGTRIFCTSRINTPRVRDELGNPAVYEILANQGDIVQYIGMRLDREYDYDDESKQMILNCLVARAEGKYFSDVCLD